MLHCWLLEWWRHYGEGCRLAVETAYRGDRLVGALPLVTFSRRRPARRDVHRRAPVLPRRRPARRGRRARSSSRRSSTARSASEHDYADLFGLAADCAPRRADRPRSSIRLFQRVEAPVLDLADGWEAEPTARRRIRASARTTSGAAASWRSSARSRSATRGRSTSSSPRSRKAFASTSCAGGADRTAPGLVTETGMRFNRAALRGLAELDASRIVSLLVDGSTIAFSLVLRARRMRLPAPARVRPRVRTLLAGTGQRARHAGVRGP